MKLSELGTGERAVIVKVSGHGGFRRRIREMGFVRGNKVKVILNAPLNYYKELGEEDYSTQYDPNFNWDWQYWLDLFGL